jgi:hypothetical protein
MKTLFTLANQRYRLQVLFDRPMICASRPTGDAAAMAAVRWVEPANSSKLELLDDLVIIGFPGKAARRRL